MAEKEVPETQAAPVEEVVRPAENALTQEQIQALLTKGVNRRRRDAQRWFIFCNRAFYSGRAAKRHGFSRSSTVYSDNPEDNLVGDEFFYAGYDTYQESDSLEDGAAKWKQAVDRILKKQAA
jgi:hypothetical protein